MRLRTVYPRPRVDALLAGVADYPLTSVVAGAGYGKTTAAAEYLRKSKLKYAWVALTHGDGAVFWDKLADAVEACRGDGVEAAGEMRVMGLPVGAWAVSRAVKFASERLREPFVVVIDDYQLLPDESPVHKLVETVAFENVPNLHILLLSRSQPNIKLYTLASKDMAMCVDAQALAFDLKETDGFLAMRGLRLTKGATAQIYARTLGWVSAIYLMGEGVRAGGEIAGLKGIEALFYENLIKPLPAADREMLYRLSAFDGFPLDMAAAALGSQRVKDVIAALMRENAFITKDEDGAYSFHALFREYLFSRCPSDGEQRSVYRRAGLWYIEQPDYRLFFSVELFRKAGCVEEFFALVNKPGPSRLRYRDRSAICRMAVELPDVLCEKYPFPYLQIVFFMLLSCDARYVQFGKELHSKMYGFFSQNDHPYKNLILGELTVIARIANLEKQTCETEPLALAARLLGGRPSAFLDPEYPFTFGLPMLLHSEYMRPGTLDEVLKKHGVNPYEAVSDGFGRGSVPLNLAEAALLRCDMKNAKRLCDQAIMEAIEKRQYFIIAGAYSTLIRRALFLADAEQAAEELQNLRELTARAARELRNNKMSVSLLRETLAYAECFFNTSLLRFDDIPPDFTDGTHPCLMTGGFGVTQMYCARAMLATGNLTGALRLCERLRDLPYVCQNARLYSLIITAVCEERLNGRGSGGLALQTALGEASEDRVILPIAENPDVLPLMKSVKRSGIDKKFLALLLERTQFYKSVAPSSPAVACAALSNRELDVLRLTAQGKTRAEVAAIFHIQENTVKAQLSSVYRKLGAKGKIEAFSTFSRSHLCLFARFSAILWQILWGANAVLLDVVWFSVYTQDKRLSKGQ